MWRRWMTGGEGRDHASAILARRWAAGGAIWVATMTFCAGSVASADTPIGIEDVIAGIRHSEDRLSSYELRFTVTKTWLWKPVLSESITALGETPPKVLRYERKSDEDRNKAMISQYVWGAKGAKFFYTQDFRDDINNLAHKEKHAFDGRRHFQLNDHRGILSGVIEGPAGPGQNIPADVICPESFFAHLGFRTVAAWLGGDSVTVSPKAETIEESSCLAIDCAGQPGALQAKIWVCPEHGFQPMKMDLYLPNGTTCRYLVKKMKEVEEGVWLPVKAVEEWYIPMPESESPVPYSVADLEVDEASLKVNPSIPDEAFVLHFPEGTTVDDRVLGLMYVAGDADATASLIDHFLGKDGQLKKDPVAELKLPPEVDAQPPDHSIASTATRAVAGAEREGHKLICLIAGAALLCALIVGFALWSRMKRRPSGSV